ncbi:tyrosine-type recombinase/integrase [Pseudomonas aeruginosa]|uniref:tyrosine-type recombinase/integrase n=1 Tax=Pseudomonas aeruginosa TaxID=287 RepID=UPI00053EBC64|nr:site-specific integrase [Pseudomonas aeruginosa]EKU7805058.1 tyrosine-type recombinase/integrase [Pseudomonas aeruginosa]EKV3146457.1 tyrosine-type recombinase/integrase [Pseudomonas aeruginosa]EKV6520664.1 tyrosine-type recombinase/integrase [Pseudomonas aeruginosa]EKW5130248.1 tyrosine-type recombinase/integrase [Pseudomonas aeruginosa]EKX3432789.1 tyrosine-type recombinase/integrase [Pseudomonas aeruginosa]
MAKLTAKQLEALTAADDGKILREDGGLVARVRAGVRGVTVQFRYEFKLDGLKRDQSLGSWPKKSLAQIRAERDEVKATASKGINPTAARKAAKIEAQAAITATITEAERQAAENKTVADLFDEWLRDGVSRQDENAELRRSFTKDVLPLIGKKPLRNLTEKDLLTVLRAVKNRGLNRAVVIRSKDIGQMLRWAEKRKPWRTLMADGNPADLVDVKKLLDHDYQEQRDRLLSPDEIRELRDIFARLEQDYDALPTGQKYSGIRPVNLRVQCAAWICLSTLCRIGELLKAEWRHVDLDKGTWFIPAEATKGHKGKRQDHHVFLSTFALAQFKRLKRDTGHTLFCFPSKDEKNHVDTKTVSKLIGDRQCRFKSRSKPLAGRHHDDSLVLSRGAKGEWTPHDLRRTGATMMQELGVTLEIIDRCQNHLLGGSKVRRHYLHHDYAKEKTEAWRLLGEKLETFMATPGLLSTTDHCVY